MRSTHSTEAVDPATMATTKSETPMVETVMPCDATSSARAVQAAQLSPPARQHQQRDGEHDQTGAEANHCGQHTCARSGAQSMGQLAVDRGLQRDQGANDHAPGQGKHFRSRHPHCLPHARLTHALRLACWVTRLSASLDNGQRERACGG